MNMKDKCPKCGGDNLEDGEWFVEQTYPEEPAGLTLTVGCVDCGYEWHEIFDHICSCEVDTGEEL